MTITVDTSGRIYEDFSRLLFYHTHREASALANEIPEESGQFRFLLATYLSNLKGSVGLTLTEASAIRISIPLDLSSRPFIPLPPPLFFSFLSHLNTSRNGQVLGVIRMDLYMS